MVDFNLLYSLWFLNLLLLADNYYRVQTVTWNCMIAWKTTDLSWQDVKLNKQSSSMSFTKLRLVFNRIDKIRIKAVKNCLLTSWLCMIGLVWILWGIAFYEFFSLILPFYFYLHTHTHTHIYIYIYIYI